MGPPELELSPTPTLTWPLVIIAHWSSLQSLGQLGPGPASTVLVTGPWSCPTLYWLAGLDWAREDG